MNFLQSQERNAVDESHGSSCISNSQPAWDRDDWYEYLSQPGRYLVELHALTEDRFLRFGSFLSNFHKRAATVSELATLIRDRMVGDEAAGGISSLQSLVERMSIFLHEIKVTSGCNEKSLRSICSALEQLHQPLQAFQRITKTLQIVAITTRIECSDFEESQDNVRHLSNSIRRLGNLISGNMNEIVDQVDILYGLSKEALRNESALNNELSSRAMAVVEQARSVLAQLVVNSNRALLQSESLTNASKAVAQSTAEIVTSIQFHDITRQQIEHVTETIEDFSSTLEKHFQTGDPADTRKLEQEIAEGCRLQAEQLTNSGDELTLAVGRIIENLQSLASNVKMLSLDTRDLSGDTERDGSNFFAAIDPAIESVAAVLADNIETADHSSKAVNEVVSAATTMAQLVDEIELFGAEMKVIALNASIESVHVKSGGSALGVIADSIQELAREALTQTDELTAGLSAITESAKTLKSKNRDDHAEHDSGVNRLVGDSDNMLAGLRQTNALLLESFDQLDQQAGSLSMDISAAASSIHVHKDASAIIERGVEALNYIADHFNTPSGPDKSAATTDLIKEMQSRYSMRSEREIHERVIGGENSIDQNGASSSETFDNHEEQTHDLGANVELF
jgi:hypothetical protein